ncbi:RING finger protein 207-like isoform X2 [Anthonomus grandis grandis]|uniref:RING finger protein 207-like isoform X2 n=1 Tax=Anthonomus grandis grandis TaxID=2921223 RepID=UPI002166407D|nr:RING finger protein 207-like isoform X2 [Anthonomus grandis grandis]
MDPPGLEQGMEFPKNPLLCPICHDYFTEPCILSCYHTFCARCLRGREQDRKLVCPFCRQPTMLKDGTFLPPPDTLMRQLIDIANSENPPCCNCDKRDRANMYYCNTCSQALCAHCRDNTHRAKMFASHEVVHMTKCQKEPKRCPHHGEHYIMYSTLQNTMLCVNCFRELPPDARNQCVDIDTAHTQAAKRLERGQNAIMDLQTSVRDGIIALKGLMDELRRNMDAEKHTINTFCQGMQEAMAKTHATMIMEVQRQYDSKERIYRSQLLLLGTVMPVLQLHLVLCTTFTAAANKYQFLELSPSLIDRLSAVGNLSQPVRSLQSSQIKTNYRSEFAQSLEPWIGPAAVSQHQSELAAASRLYDTAPPATKKQQTSLKTKILEGDSSFSAHCRSFESQIRELNQQFNKVKEKVTELHKDINAIRKAQTPPLTARYEMLVRECLHLDQTLERQQQELDRMATAFDQSWEEQLWRLRVEQEVFSCQRADVNTLRNELKHLSQVATQLEPYIRTLTPSGGLGGAGAQSSTTERSQEAQQSGDQAQQIASLLETMGILQYSDPSAGSKIPRSRSRVLGQLLEKVRPSVQERERSKSAGQSEKPTSATPVPKTPKKAFCASSTQMNVDSVSRFEAQIREKLHDIMCRRQSTQPSSKSDTEMDKKLKQEDRKLSKAEVEGILKQANTCKLSTKQKILYKKIGKSCDKINAMAEKRCKSMESEYQRISDATSQKLPIKETSRSSPSSPKCKNKIAKSQQQSKSSKKKVYPYSDGEDNIFYSFHDSNDSLSTSSRRSSLDAAATAETVGPDKTLVVVINRRQKGASQQTLAQKQRSWETFPPKHKRHHVCQAKLSAPPQTSTLKKTDSFEEYTF